MWFDALINYVSAAPAGWWSDGVRKRHVIGKGIVRFHAVVWPAILLSAGLPLPDELFVHDYVTAGGRKIGKSLGNVVDPFSLVERYGADALRWWLVREVPRVGEADFGEERLVHAANRDLANGIGNLVHRIAGLAPGVGGFEPGEGARDLVPRLRDDVDRAIASFDVRAASIALVDAVDEVNRFLEAEQPWKRRDDDGRAAVASATVAVRSIVAEAAPFVPALAERAQRARFPVYERR